MVKGYAIGGVIADRRKLMGEKKGGASTNGDLRGSNLEKRNMVLTSQKYSTSHNSKKKGGTFDAKATTRRQVRSSHKMEEESGQLSMTKTTRAAAREEKTYKKKKKQWDRNDEQEEQLARVSESALKRGGGEPVDKLCTTAS